MPAAKPKEILLKNAEGGFFDINTAVAPKVVIKNVKVVAYIVALSASINLPFGELL